MQISNPLADPLVILVLQIIIAAAGVLVSFLVANYWGEMAATKFTLNEARRREHALLLVGEPLQRLRNELPYVEGILSVWPDSTDELRIRKANIHDTVFPEIQLLIEHLKTGHQQLYQTILDCQESYNKLADRSLAIYQKAMEVLKKISSGSSTDQPFILDRSLARVMDVISQEVTNRLVKRNSPQVPNLAEGEVVRLGSCEIARVAPGFGNDAKRIINAINSLFESREIFGGFQCIWEESQPLLEERRRIDYQLECLKAYGLAGVHLRGSCPAGIEAGYEKS